MNQAAIPAPGSTVLRSVRTASSQSTRAVVPRREPNEPAPRAVPASPRAASTEREAYLQNLADRRARGQLSIDPLAIADAILRRERP